MNEIYDQVIAQHLALQEAPTSDPDAVPGEEIQRFIRQARKAGADVVDLEQHDRLRNVLRQWGGLVYERTGEYPPVQLAPVSESNAKAQD